MTKIDELISTGISIQIEIILFFLPFKDFKLLRQIEIKQNIDNDILKAKNDC